MVDMDTTSPIVDGGDFRRESHTPLDKLEYMNCGASSTRRSDSLVDLNIDQNLLAHPMDILRPNAASSLFGHSLSLPHTPLHLTDKAALSDSELLSLEGFDHPSTYMPATPPVAATSPPTPSLATSKRNPKKSTKTPKTPKRNSKRASPIAQKKESARKSSAALAIGLGIDTDLFEATPARHRRNNSSSNNNTSPISPPSSSSLSDTRVNSGTFWSPGNSSSESLPIIKEESLQYNMAAGLTPNGSPYRRTSYPNEYNSTYYSTAPPFRHSNSSNSVPQSNGEWAARGFNLDGLSLAESHVAHTAADHPTLWAGSLAAVSQPCSTSYQMPAPIHAMAFDDSLLSPGTEQDNFFGPQSTASSNNNATTNGYYSPTHGNAMPYPNLPATPSITPNLNTDPFASAGSGYAAPFHTRRRSKIGSMPHTPPSRSPSRSRSPDSGRISSRRSSKNSPKSRKSSSSASRTPGISLDSMSFVNYTPTDSQRILAGVAPSGSSKTKARREKEAAEKQKALMEALRKAGGNVDQLGAGF